MLYTERQSTIISTYY